MKTQNKLDAIDFIIGILLEHEKKLDVLVDRLEKNTELLENIIENKKFANGNSWQLNNVNEKGPITYQYNNFYDGIIAVPPEAYFGISAEEYAFKVDWGTDYPDDLGFDLECEYFKRQTAGAPEPGEPQQYTTAAGNPEGTGVLNSPWWPCMQNMS